MITGFLVFKDGEFKGVESFIEKYEGHFEVLADVHRRHGFEVEPIYSECKPTSTEIHVLAITKFADKDQQEVAEQFNIYFTTLEKAQDFITNNFKYDNVRKISDEHYEGSSSTYKIESHVVLD